MTAWSDAEKQILAAHGAGNYSKCTELAVRFAAPFIKAHFRKSVSDRALIEDAFSEWSELVASTWPKFNPQYSVSTWLYVLARRPRRRALELSAQRVQQEAELDTALSAPTDRAATAPFVRTTAKHEFRELWAELDAKDRELLQLRIEQALSWEQVARKLRGPQWRPTSEELKRETQMLAARYKRRIKDALTEGAVRRGIIDKYGVE